MNENKKINNLKKVIVLISIAILVVAVILIMSIYNNKFGKTGDDGIKGGKSTVKTTQLTDIIFDPETGDQILNISDKKSILVSGESLEDSKSVKSDSKNNVLYKTNEKNSNFIKATIKDKDENEDVLGNELFCSSEEEETVIISSSYIETLSPAKYTIYIFYKGEDGKEKTVSFSFEVEERWPEEPTTEEPTIPTPTEGTTKVTVTKTRTIPPTSGTVIVTQPAKNYTVITSGGSGHENADSSAEWAILNAINAKRSKPLKMAKELRTFAENNATKAVTSFTESTTNGCSASHQDKCKCDIDPAKYDNVSYCASEKKDVTKAVNMLLSANVGILDEDYEYIGIGVVYNTKGHYSWVVTID